MEHKTQNFTLTSEHDGLKLSCFSIVPENPRGVVQMIHGMLEYKERYMDLAQYLADKGFCVVMHDHRGHGASVRTKDDLGYFYADGAQGAVADARLVSAYCKEHFPDVPLFVFAHSMGTLVARAMLAQDDAPYAGVILCGSPSANPMAGIGVVLLKTAAFFKGDRTKSSFAANLCMGAFNKKFESEGKNAWICTDPAVRERYNADPLCSYMFSLNGYIALLTLMKRAYAKDGWAMHNSDLPIRFIAGADDPCIVDEAAFSKAVGHLQGVGYTAVTGRLFPDMRHEIHNETEHMQVFQDIEKTLFGWLKLAQKRKKD